jgi:predicted membrane chloride channel (bestrophin family)
MVYSKAKLKSNDKKQLLVSDHSEEGEHHTNVYFTKHILISLNSFIGKLHSKRMLNNISILAIGYLEVFITEVLSHCTPIIFPVPYKYSVQLAVNLLCWNPH